MEITAFNTHDFVKRLTSAGMSEPQAEILAEELSRLIKERLATKRDLKEMEQKLTIKLGAIMVIGVSVLAALVKLL